VVVRMRAAAQNLANWLNVPPAPARTTVSVDVVVCGENLTRQPSGQAGKDATLHQKISPAVDAPGVTRWPAGQPQDQWTTHCS
jgi:hypothetical protein